MIGSPVCGELVPILSAIPVVAMPRGAVSRPSTNTGVLSPFWILGLIACEGMQFPVRCRLGGFLGMAAIDHRAHMTG